MRASARGAASTFFYTFGMVRPKADTLLIELLGQFTVTPRCLWLSTMLIGILSKTSCGRKSSFLNVNKTASVFSGLNATNHCLAQLVNSCRSVYSPDRA